jgi:hypothetical protein
MEETSNEESEKKKPGGKLLQANGRDRCDRKGGIDGDESLSGC